MNARPSVDDADRSAGRCRDSSATGARGRGRHHGQTGPERSPGAGRSDPTCRRSRCRSPPDPRPGQGELTQAEVGDRGCLATELHQLIPRMRRLTGMDRGPRREHLQLADLGESTGPNRVRRGANRPAGSRSDRSSLMKETLDVAIDSRGPEKPVFHRDPETFFGILSGRGLCRFDRRWAGPGVGCGGLDKLDQRWASGCLRCGGFETVAARPPRPTGGRPRGPAGVPSQPAFDPRLSGCRSTQAPAQAAAVSTSSTNGGSRCPRCGGFETVAARPPQPTVVAFWRTHPVEVPEILLPQGPRNYFRRLSPGRSDRSAGFGDLERLDQRWASPCLRCGGFETVEARPPQPT